MSLAFTINKAGFEAEIYAPVTVATTQATKELVMAGRITLEAKDGKLYFSANGGRVSIRKMVDGLSTDLEIKSEGSVTVKAQDLSNSLVAFEPKEVLEISIGTMAKDENSNGEELVIKSVKKPKVFVSLPVYIEAVTVSEPLKKFDQEISFRRDVFVDAINRIKFAGGLEEKKARYRYFIIRGNQDVARFANGDGNRFIVLDVEGQGVVKADKHFELLIPHTQSDVFCKVFSLLPQDYITIKRNGSDDSAQFVFECGDLTLVLVGFDPAVKWIDEDTMLKRPVNNYKLVTTLAEWERPLKTLEATNNKEGQQLSPQFKVLFSFNLDDKEIVLKSERQMRAQHLVEIKDFFADGSVAPFTSFRVLEQHFAEMLKSGNKGDNIQFDVLNNTQPMLVRFYAGDKAGVGDFTRINSSLGVKEKLSIFLSPFQGAE